MLRNEGPKLFSRCSAPLHTFKAVGIHYDGDEIVEILRNNFSDANEI